ncbi:hypothetical protein B0H13DRAFT_2518422 [Mycena leptocephala]|nr:hypothetical protein B0H13DRAFT_2518422 [Mycena leptocephala]
MDLPTQEVCPRTRIRRRLRTPIRTCTRMEKDFVDAHQMSVHILTTAPKHHGGVPRPLANFLLAPVAPHPLWMRMPHGTLHSEDELLRKRRANTSLRPPPLSWCTSSSSSSTTFEHSTLASSSSILGHCRRPSLPALAAAEDLSMYMDMDSSLISRLPGSTFVNLPHRPPPPYLLGLLLVIPTRMSHSGCTLTWRTSPHAQSESIPAPTDAHAYAHAAAAAAPIPTATRTRERRRVTGVDLPMEMVLADVFIAVSIPERLRGSITPQSRSQHFEDGHRLPCLRNVARATDARTIPPDVTSSEKISMKKDVRGVQSLACSEAASIPK